jgi:hypothetical protein
METFKKWAPVILVLGAMAVIGVIAVVNSLRCDLLYGGVTRVTLASV